jgi:hypothetical protein
MALARDALSAWSGLLRQDGMSVEGLFQEALSARQPALRRVMSAVHAGALKSGGGLKRHVPLSTSPLACHVSPFFFFNSVIL